MKQLIEDLISAMEYHVEQTRPIHMTTVAIQAAKDALKAMPAQEPVQDWKTLPKKDAPLVEWAKGQTMPAAQPTHETDMLTIAYQSGYHDGKKAALAGREWNFCERCGKRTKDLTTIHTCTPPQEGE
jgi:hypothetical protein